jgi:hypothetical protein
MIDKDLRILKPTSVIRFDAPRSKCLAGSTKRYKGAKRFHHYLQHVFEVASKVGRRRDKVRITKETGAR